MASRKVPRALAIAAARMTRVVTWVTNVFDAATAISGPACRNRTASASRVIAEPTVLVTAMTGQPALAGEAGRGDRVGRLARLGHGDDERPAVERRRGVAELRADRGAGRQPGPVLEGGRADERCVVGAAAGDELDPVDLAERLGEPGDLVDLDAAVAGHPAGDGRPERQRLLVHLLEHEVVVAALLGGLERPVDDRDDALARQRRRRR